VPGGSSERPAIRNYLPVSLRNQGGGDILCAAPSGRREPSAVSRKLLGSPPSEYAPVAWEDQEGG
jgi:hypothetical protein